MEERMKWREEKIMEEVVEEKRKTQGARAQIKGGGKSEKIVREQK